MQTLRLDRTRFERLVEEAVASLPRFFQERLENVAIIIQDYPGPEVQGHRERGRDCARPRHILGLYYGVPRPQRSVWYQPPLPDVIYIYQRNIEAICRTEEEVKAQVRQTVIHEIGHYFGLTDEELERLQSDED